MKKRFIILSVLVLMCLCLFAGCKNETFYGNAVLYDRVDDLVKEDFKNQNRLKDSYYGEGVDSSDCPKERTFIVNDRENCNSIFADNFSEIDFEKQTLIVYTATVIYINPAKIKSINYDNGELAISYAIQLKVGTGSATSPQQRWFAVAMDKTEITSVTFTESYDSIR